MFNEIKDQNKIEKFVNNLRHYKRKSILQETTIAYLVHTFPDMEEVVDACKLFNKIDLNDNGQIDALSNIIKINPDENIIKSIFK